jgi:GTPase SAR1 family protein
MKIAFTGASSTGKTTLAKRLMRMPEFVKYIPHYVTTDARRLLEGMGFRSMDTMSRDELRSFESHYYVEKIKSEGDLNSFVTDRSFVDVAAYWVCRDTFDRSREESMQLEVPCYNAAKRYDVHYYFPLGAIPFEDDGYRSVDMELHRKIDRQIIKYLNEWHLSYIRLDSQDLESRARRVADDVRGAVR